MTGDLQPTLVSFIYNGLVLFKRNRWDRDHLAVAPEGSRSCRLRLSPALVVFRLINLDPVDAVVRMVAHRGAGGPRTIDVLSVLPDGTGIETKWRDHRGRRIISGTARGQTWPGDLHTRTRHHTFINSVAQLNSSVGVGRPHILNGGETRVEVLEGVMQSDKRRARIVRVRTLHQVHVAVN